MKEIAIGIDIGGTFTKFGFVDKEGNCIFESSISTAVHGNVDTFLTALTENIDKSLNDYSNEKEQVEVIGIGVGAPNGNYFSGSIEFAPNLKWGGIIPMVEMLKKYYDLPIALTNDANAAAIGEMLYGAAKGMKNFVVITLGTGLGSGIVVNGELVYGHDGFAGEIGHTTYKPFGRQCACGKRGCLETYVSATGIKRTVFKLLADHTSTSNLRSVSFNDLTAKMIFEEAEKGDEIAKQAFEYTGIRLGRALANTVAHLSPEAIFLLGGLAKSKDYILKPTREHYEQNVLNIFKGKVKILPSGLEKTNVAVLGAGALIWNEISKTEMVE